MNTNTNHIYAAGYIDGDGCFYIGKYRSKYIADIFITSTDRDILEWFKNQYGGTITTPKKPLPGREHHKPVYYYRIRKKRSIALAKSILPFLLEKQEEAKLFIAFIESSNCEERQCHISKMKVLKESTNLVREELKDILLKSKSIIQPSIYDCAYFAGFIDAECCFYISKYLPKGKPNYVYKISLSCNNSKFPIFKWLLEHFGGSIRFIDRHSKDPKQRDQFVWSISAAALADIIGRIHTFLKYKKPVCKQLMKFYATTIADGVSRKTEEFRRNYAKIIEERERIVHEVHRLNKKGIS